MEENKYTPEKTKPVLPEAKPVLPEAGASKIPTLPRAGGARPATELPQAKAPQVSFAPKNAPIPVQPMASNDNPGVLSVAIDFAAAAVAIAFTVMVFLDI